MMKLNRIFFPGAWRTLLQLSFVYDETQSDFFPGCLADFVAFVFCLRWNSIGFFSRVLGWLCCICILFTMKLNRIFFPGAWLTLLHLYLRWNSIGFFPRVFGGLCCICLFCRNSIGYNYEFILSKIFLHNGYNLTM